MPGNFDIIALLGQHVLVALGSCSWAILKDSMLFNAESVRSANTQHSLFQPLSLVCRYAMFVPILRWIHRDP